MPVTAAAEKTRRETSIRRGPAAFSMLKGSTSMTTKTTKPATADQTPATQTAAIVTDLQAQLKAAEQQLAQAREAAKQLRLQAKAEREATKDTRSKLERVIARQFADNGGKWLRINVTHRAYERVKAGQPVEQAIDEVLAQYRALMLETLSLPTADTATAPASAE